MTPEQIILALRSADNHDAVAKAIDLRDELINTIYANATSPDRAETPYRQLAELQAELRKLERHNREINDVLSDAHLYGDGCVREVLRCVDRVEFGREALDRYHVLGRCLHNDGYQILENKTAYVMYHMATAREVLVKAGWIEGVNALSTLSEGRIDPWGEGSEAEETDEDEE